MGSFASGSIAWRAIDGSEPPRLYMPSCDAADSRLWVAPSSRVTVIAPFPPPGEIVVAGELEAVAGAELLGHLGEGLDLVAIPSPMLLGRRLVTHCTTAGHR